MSESGEKMNWQGPNAIDELRSAPYRVGFRPAFWLSSARLRPQFDRKFGGRFSVPLYGSGWGKTQEESARNCAENALLFQAHRLLQDPSPNPWGYALVSSSVGVERGIQEAIQNSLGTWCLNEIDRLGKAGLKPWNFGLRNLPERKLLRRQKLPAVYLTRVASWIVAVVVGDSIDRGILLATGAGVTEKEAAGAALRSYFLRKRRFERFLFGHEQILDSIEDQRLFLYGISPLLRAQALERIEAAVDSTGIFQTVPRFTFQGEIFGPWNPDFHLVQVIYEGMAPLSQGGIERMVF